MMEFTSYSISNSDTVIGDVESKSYIDSSMKDDSRSEDSVHARNRNAPRRVKLKPGHGHDRSSCFVTPGSVRQTSIFEMPQKNLFQSENSKASCVPENDLKVTLNEDHDNDNRKEAPWKSNVSELSPDSRELFEDLEEAERGQEQQDQEHFAMNVSRNLFLSAAKDNNASVNSANASFDLSTPNLVKNHLQKAYDFNLYKRSGNISIQASGSGESTIDGHFSPGEGAIFAQASQRLTFSATSASASHGYVMSPLSSSAQTMPMNRNEQVIDLRSPARDGITSSSSDATVHDLTETTERPKTDAELMDESERLARQLMEEEEALLCERIQQEQMRIIAEMRQAQRAAANEANEGSDGDLALALRIADEEDGEDEEINPDQMSYDELLELGEQIGDVKQERWRITGRQHVLQLQTIKWQSSSEAADSADNLCVVCQEMYISDELLKVLPCQHRFHTNCIDAWLKDHDTCVVCKKSIVEI